MPELPSRGDIFGHGGGEQMAEHMDVPFLGRLPVYQPIRVGGDRGIPLVIAEPESAGARLHGLAEGRGRCRSPSPRKNAIANKGKIPLIQVK